MSFSFYSIVSNSAYLADLIPLHVDSLPGTHKIVYSCDPERGSEDYLITNALASESQGWEKILLSLDY